MNILIIGSGAREHILAKSCYQSPTKNSLFCCGTTSNPGIKQYTTDYVLIDINNPDLVLQQALIWNINLAIIGPEAPLEKGLADLLEHHGILTVGPKKKSARLETSKSFARHLLTKHRIHGSPKYRYFDELTQVKAFLQELGENNYVVKANGLMGGKGVKVAGDHLHSIDEAFDFCEQLHQQGCSFLIEEKLVGQEFSLLNFFDGERLIPMPLVQDHKRAFVGDKGPNTGGMGSYSDANHRLPFISQTDIDAAQRINEAVMPALRAECHEVFRGILYGSFMATKNGVYLIEYNTRFGDPEILNILSILEGDFVQLCLDLARGSLYPENVRFKPLATVCKYAVPLGYPDAPLENTALSISESNNKDRLYFAQVNECDGQLTATGSRAVAVVGVGDTIYQAEKMAEEEILRIKGSLFHREDIGTRALIEQRMRMMEAIRGEVVA